MANIQNELNNIKTALYGKDVRESIHNGIGAINNEVESTTGRQVDLENTFDQLVINAGNSNAEIVDARVKSDGTSYSKLGDRLNEVDSQLEHNTNKIENLSIINVKDYGAKGDGITNDTQAIQSAIDYVRSIKGGKIIIPKGVYIIDHLEIRGERTCLYLEAGVTLKRLSTNTIVEPMIYINSVYSSIVGEGVATSYVKCENNSPEGVIAIGDIDSVKVKGSCGYNSIKNIMIEGAGSKQSGEGNKGIVLRTDDGHVDWSYYHTIRDIHIRFVNTGIALIGNANANIIDGVVFTSVGNENYLLEDSAILLKDIKKSDPGYFPLDNVISNTFHTGSNNATTIKQIGRSGYNTFSNINGEPGGSECVWYSVIGDDEYTQKSCGNNISGCGVYFAGHKIPKWFFKVNTVDFGGILFNSPRIESTNLTTTNLKTDFINHNTLLKHNNRVIEKSYSMPGVTQATNYEIFRYDIGSSKAIINFDIHVMFDSLTVNGLQKSGNIKLSYNGQSWGEVKIEGYTGIEPMEIFNMPVVQDGNLIFTVKTPTIGTATKFNGYAFIKVSSVYELSEDKVIIPTSLNTPSITYEQIILTRGAGGTGRQKGYFIGQTYFDTTAAKLSVFNGSAWLNVN